MPVAISDYASSYPLTGIRTASVSWQPRMKESALEVLRADSRVLAVWLAGSLATGQADPWSDLDLHICVADEAIDAFRGRWMEGHAKRNHANCDGDHVPAPIRGWLFALAAVGACRSRFLRTFNCGFVATLWDRPAIRQDG